MVKKSQTVKRSAATAIFVTLVAICGLGSPATAATTNGDRHQRILRRLERVLNAIDALNVPGYVVGVTGGEVGSLEQAHGFADVSTSQPMTLNTHFRIGSISKTFTATVILKLVQSGRLQLNDPISIWEPQVPNAKRITIKMLLNMTSGIFDEGGSGPQGQTSSLSQALTQNCNPKPPKQPTVLCQQYWPPQQIVDLAIDDSKTVPGGAAYEPGIYYYSDTNYVILGIIAQRVTGKPFATLLKQLVLDPLHLKQTSFPTKRLTLPSPAATGYTPEGNGSGGISGYEVQDEPSPSAFFGAGNIVSTLHDLQVWARAVATGQLLTPTLQRLRLQVLPIGGFFSPLAGTTQTTIALPLQYGLGISDAGGMLGHNGRIPGYTAEMWYLPSARGTVVALFNSVTGCIEGQAPFEIPGVLADGAFVSLAQAAFGPALQRTSLIPPMTCPTPSG